MSRASSGLIDGEVPARPAGGCEGRALIETMVRVVDPKPHKLLNLEAIQPFHWAKAAHIKRLEKIR